MQEIYEGHVEVWGHEASSISRERVRSMFSSKVKGRHSFSTGLIYFGRQRYSVTIIQSCN